MHNLKELTKEKINSLSFEEALSILDEIIVAQSDGNTPLEDAINMYDIGMNLKSACEAHLNNAKMRVEKISFSNDGSIIKEKFE